MHASPRIVFHNLFYTYPGSPGHALRGIDLAIASGSYVAVLGGNGSGKSTLLKCANGLVVPTTGGVTVYDDRGTGFDPAVEAAAVRRIAGTVLQNPDDMIVGTIVEEDVAFGPQNLGLDADAVRVRVAAALEAVGLGACRTRPPQFLSGGEKARLAVAGALAMDPRALLLDEPASMLDPRGRESLLAVLDRLAASGTTIVHVTHALEDAARAGRCLVLHRGELVFDGDAPTLFAQEKLERWGLRLPESVKALQVFFRLFPGFSAPTLEPEAVAAALLPYLAALDQEGDAAPQPAAPGASSPAAHEARPASCALRFDAVGHDYLPGTPFAATGIREVSLTVPEGTSLALVGTTGSGKSTLLRHANAVLLPCRGRVLVLGLDTQDRRVDLQKLRLRATLGVQNPESALFEPFIADDVAFGPHNKGLQGAPLRAAVRQALESTGLAYEEYKDCGTRDLSGGEKRRAALAGVLALDGELLLLDEPTAALDGVGRERILQVLNELRAQGKTVLATTHSMEEAAGFDQVAIMQEGVLAALGPPEHIFGARWKDDWGLALPWTAAVAAELRRQGRYPLAAPPLSAAALIAGLGGRTAEEGPPPAVQAPAVPGPCIAAEVAQPKRRRRGTGVEFFRNVTLGQFLDRPSCLLRRSAGTKMAVLLALALMAILGPRPVHTLGVLLFTLGLGAAAGRIGPKHLLRGLVPALPYLALMVAVQFAFAWPGDAGPVLMDGGVFTVTAAELARSLLLVLRLATLMALLSLYSALTPLAESLRTLNAWIAPLGRLGFPVREFSLAFGIALRFVPVLVEEAERIAVAQISRGGGYGGRKRLRAAAALIVPLFLRALERSETLAAAMELRLFGKNPPGGS